MRKMRRIVAFVLAVMMIASNTVTASATSVSAMPNVTVVDDTQIVATTTANDEEEVITTTSEESEEEEVSSSTEEVPDEPSGETGSEGENETGDVPGNGTGDVPSTTTESGEEDSDDSSSVVETTEAVTETETETVTTEEETTTEELTTEELTTEADVLGEATGDSTYKLRVNEDGGFVELGYYATLDEVKTAIEADGRDIPYEVCLQADITLAEDMDFSCADVRIFGFNHTITVTEDVFIKATALFGKANFDVAKDKTLTLCPNSKYNDTMYITSTTTFTFDESATEGGLQLGRAGEDGEVCIDSPVSYTTENEAVKFVNSENVELTVYSDFEYCHYWGYKYIWGTTEELGTPLVFKKINFEKNSAISDRVIEIGVPVEADYITVKTDAMVYSVDVAQGMTGYKDTNLYLTATSNVNNLTLEGEETDQDQSFEFVLDDVYDQNTQERLSRSEVNLTGTLTKNTNAVIQLSKRAMDISIDVFDGGSTTWVSQNMDKSIVYPGTKLATITPAESDTALADISNYWFGWFGDDAVQEKQQVALDISETSVAGTYEAVAYKDSDKIWLNKLRMEDNGYIEWESSRGFDTLKEIKDYIEQQNNPEQIYSINLNSNVTLEGDELDYSSIDVKHISLNLENKTVTVPKDSTMHLSYIGGKEDSIASNNIILGADATLTIEQANWSDGSVKVTCEYVTFQSKDTKKPGSIVLGSSDQNGYVDLYKVKFANKINEFHLFGDVNAKLINAATVNHFYVENAEYCARVEGGVIATNYIGNGNLEIDELKISGTAEVLNTKGITVMPGGSAEFNHIIVNNAGEKTEDGGDYLFNVLLNKNIVLAASDDTENPTFEDASYTDWATMKVTGTVKTALPIYIGGDGVYEEYSYTKPYIYQEGDVLLTTTSTAVTAGKFCFDNENDSALIPVKDGNDIKVGRRNLSVELYAYDENYEETFINEVSYTSFEDAIANIANDFADEEGNPVYGKYIFRFQSDATLSKDITFPDCVEEAVFDTDGVQMIPDNEESWVPIQRTLDLNGKTMTTKCPLYLGNGLRLTSPEDKKATIKRAAGGGTVVLDIYEGLLVDEEGKWILTDGDGLPANAIEAGAEESSQDRLPALSNITVDAANYDVFIGEAAQVYDFYNEWSEEVEYPRLSISMDSVSLNIRRMDVAAGNTEWNMNGGIITASGDFMVHSGTLNTSVLSANCGLHINEAVLIADTINLPASNTYIPNWMMISSGSYVEVGELNLATAKSKSTARLSIEADYDDEGNITRCGTLVADKITVAKAYAADANGDYTIYNNGNLSVGTLTMSTGTFYNGHCVEAGDMAVKDFIAGENTNLSCNTFNNTGKAVFYRSNVMLINGKTVNNTPVVSTLNNVYADYGMYDDPACIGHASDAKVTFKGSFTVANEGQMVNVFVTDNYKEIYGNDGQIDWVDLDPANLTAVEEDSVLFDVDAKLKTFPTEALYVLQPEGNESSDAVYRDGNELKVTGNYVSVEMKMPDGSTNWLSSFSTWKAAVDYIDTLNNPDGQYVILVNKNGLNVNGALTLPKKAQEIIVATGLGYEEESEEEGKDPVWIQEKVSIAYNGSITLNSNTIFDGIILDSTADGTIVAGSNQLVFANTTMAEGDKIKAITGSNYMLSVENGSDITVASALSKVALLNMWEEAHLTVEGGLSTTEIYSGSETGSENTLTVNNLIVKGKEKESKLEVKESLYMDNVLSIHAEGTVVLKDVYSNVKGNTIYTKSNDKLTVSGRILSSIEAAEEYRENEGNGKTLETLVKVTETVTVDGEAVEITYYREMTEDERTGWKTTGTVVNADGETMPTTDIMPYAVTVITSDVKANDTVLATAEKVSPIWFKSQIKADDETVYTVLTYKDEKKIVTGTNEDNNVILSSWVMGATEPERINSFATLQEAFTEINKIANENMDYVITLKEDVPVLTNAKGKEIDFTFPTKANEITIQSAEEATRTIAYSKNIKLGSNIVFENVQLVAKTAKGNVDLNGFVLVLKDSILNDGIAYNVKDGSKKTTSALVLENSKDAMEVIVDGTLVADYVKLCNADLTVTGTSNIGTLCMDNAETFIGKGAITVTDIVSDGQSGGTVVTYPKVEWKKVTLEDGSKEDVVKKITQTMTIGGNITGILNVDLGCIQGTEEYEISAANGIEEFEEKGIPFAKAVNVNTYSVELLAYENGSVYKKAGILTYKDSAPLVELVYYTDPEDENSEVVTSCETFADAVAEINNLKTKRDYFVVFVADDTEMTPANLTMPNAKYVDTLYLSSGFGDGEAASVYYQSGITFTSNVVLDNLHFVKVAKNEDGDYEEITDEYVAPVAVKVNGAYTLDMSGDVQFNTPIQLSGAKKAILNVTPDAVLTAALYNVEAPDAGAWIVQGSVKDFAQVNVTGQTLNIESYLTLNSKKAEVYNKGELNVTELNVSDYGKVVVGQETVVSGSESNVLTNTATVANLNVSDGALISGGSLTLTNATLSGEAKIAAYGQNFAINGTLTSATQHAELITGLNTKYESALKLDDRKGTVVLEDPADKIKVQVVAVYVEADETEKLLTVDNEITLGDAEDTFFVKQGRNTVEKYVPAKLLTTKNAAADMFMANDFSVGGTQVNSVGAYTKDNPNGYILTKSGKDVVVRYGNEVGAVLYKNDVVHDYYTDVNGAVAEIESLKDKEAEYKIELLKDFGSTSSYAKLNMPTQAAKVTFYTDMTEENAVAKNLYYNNDLKLGCVTVFDHAELMPQAVRGKYKGITMKDFALILMNLSASTVGKVNGTALSLISSNLTTTDTVTITNLDLNLQSELYSQKGNATIVNVVFDGSEHNSIRYGSNLLTIKGELSGINQIPLKLIVEAEKAPLAIGGTKVALSKDSQLATIEKAVLNDTVVKFEAGQKSGETVTLQDVSATVRANKAVYWAENNASTATIKDTTGTVLAECLDLTQAVTYINTVSDKTRSYVIDLTGVNNTEGRDVNLTDTKYGTSAMTMPGKDKAAEVTVCGDGSTEIAFAGKVTTYGNVTFEEVVFANTSASEFIHKENTAQEEAVLTFINTAHKSVDKISGNKATTIVQITDDSDADMNFASISKVKKATMNITDKNGANVTVGTMSDVANLALINAKLVTTGKANIGALTLGKDASWEVEKAGSTVAAVSLVEVSEENCLKVHQEVVKRAVVPALTINGSVNTQIPVAVFDVNDVELDNTTEETKIDNVKLLVAKTESADKFIAKPYAAFNEETTSFGFADDATVKAYKDKSNNVYNGDISKMEALLTEVDEYGNEIDGTQTYAADYAEAVGIIDAVAKTDADYKITLRNTGTAEDGGNGGIIKTAAGAAYGKLVLPAANKAASLTITGESADVQLQFTGSVQPKCDLNFENITLTEGKWDSGKKVYTPYNYLSLAYSGVTVSFGDAVNVPVVENVLMGDSEDYNLAFNTIKVTDSKAGMGVLDLSGNAAYVRSTVSVANMDVKQGENAILASLKTVQIGNINENNVNPSGNEVATSLEVRTAYNNTKDWYEKPGTTRFTVTGECDNELVLNLVPYYGMVDGNKVVGYQELSAEDLQGLFYDGYGTPSAEMKLVTANKLQSESVAVKALDEAMAALPEDAQDWEREALSYNVVKYNGGVYMTQSYPSISVYGLDISEDGEELVYTGSFFTWEQAVNEIDKLNQKERAYMIELSESIGIYGDPIKNLTMPSKAKYVGITSADDNKNVCIAMTGTSINLKTDTGIAVPIVAVKQTAGNYYNNAYTIKVGNYELEMLDIPNGIDTEFIGYFEPQMKVEGSAKGSFTYSATEEWSSMIQSIKNVGTVTLNPGSYVNEDGAEVTIHALYMEGGISGVTTLTMTPGIRVESPSKDVTVKNLVIGEEGTFLNTETNEYELNPYESNGYRADLYAKNITVSDTLTMASASLQAGTKNVGDGKVTLNNVIFNDYCNDIMGKQDKNGNSLIQIKGTANVAEDYMDSCNSAVTIGLYYNNSSMNFARLTEGMTLLTAPKAAASLFRPCYGYEETIREENEETGEVVEYTNIVTNMGMEIGAEFAIQEWNEANQRMELVLDENGNPVTEWTSLYGLYKSGNNIEYGQIREQGVFDGVKPDGTVVENLPEVHDLSEARVWIGTTEPWTSTYVEFKTFEEAVKAIDSMNLKDGKENLAYCIELLTNVEIGNEKGDNKYKAISLPSKASEVLIQGNGYSITFSGNVSLRCNTTFRDLNLMPVKLVKGELIPTEVNLSAGKFVATWNCSSIIAMDENGEWTWDYDLGFVNVTGSGKAELVIGEDTYLKAKNVTGLNAIRFVDKDNMDGLPGRLWVPDKVNVKEIIYDENATGTLNVQGDLTINGVRMYENANANIVRYDNNKTMKVNGITWTEKVNGKNVKYFDSVIRENNDLPINVYVMATESETVAPGTKVMTDKYLDMNDWALTGEYYTEDADKVEVFYTSYQSGNNLFVGTEIPTN